ncbi:MAG: ZIP family metal transporter [Bacteroidetes bacterium]|nr:ZIP family metal transporter [Bacteroidota bacterium]
MSYFLQSIILFFTVIVGGLSVFFIPKINNNTFKYSLVFTGSYLFAITILHILPDIYHHYSLKTGIFIIIGFYIQLILEFFSGGIEHGHIHEYHEKKDKNIFNSSISLFIPLFIHALLDSVILLDNSHCGVHEFNNLSLLIGIILHKLPAAFALVLLIFSINKNKRKTILYLIAFALASPLGLFLGNQFLNITNDNLILLKAIASGSFLSISITIFIETNPDHALDKRKILVSVLGVIIAVLTEFLH